MLPDKEEVISAYKRFCRLCQQPGLIVSLEQEQFLFPTTLLPLKIHCINHQKTINYPRDAKIARYFKIFMGELTYPQTPKSSYLSVTPLPQSQAESDETFKRIIDVCEDGRALGGKDPFSYYVNELLDNIYDHSGFTQAYVAVQGYRKQKFVEIVIVDNGITIPGRYESKGITKESDIDYIKMALEGKSTKEDNKRGFGLHTSLKVVVDLIGGQFFLFSRGGGLAVDNHEHKLLILTDDLKYAGTLICIRIPYPAPLVNQDEFYKAISN